MRREGSGTIRAVLACAALVAASAAILLAMGRPPICTCGHVALWYGSATGRGTSQHLFDPYSFSHVLHGFLFYGLAWLIGRLRGRPLAFGHGLILATAIECAWELVENTPWIIGRYRAGTMALGYEGDSVVNSLMDILSTMAGYGLAATLPVAGIVVLALAIEVVLAWLIRDNLTLNVLMLLHPIESIKAWQAGT